MQPESVRDTEGIYDKDAGVKPPPPVHVDHQEIATVPGMNSDRAESLQEEADEAIPHLHAKTILIVATVAFVYFSQVFFLIGVGAFGRDVGEVVGDPENAAWLVNVAAIAVLVLSTPVSQAADYWGRRWFIIVFCTIGFVGCIVLATAKSMGIAIAGATIASIGSGAQPLLHAIASEVLPRRYRMTGQAALNGSAAFGAFVGLMVGGGLTNGNPNGFRVYFYLTAGFFAVAAVICVVFYTPPPRELQLRLTQREKLGRLDWVGSALLAIGFTLFVMGLSWADNPYAWDDVHVLVPLLTGAAFIIVLIVFEWKFKSDGVFHHGLFSRNRNFALAAVCVFIEGLVFFAANEYFVYEISLVYEANLLIALLHFGLTFLVFTLVCPITAAYCNRTKKIRIPLMLSFASLITFNICMATAELGSGTATWGYVIFLGIGMGICLPTVMTAAQLSAPRELIATTSGLMISLRSLGGAVGLGIYGSIFNSKLNKGLPTGIADAVLPLGFPASSLPDLIRDLASSEISLIPTIPGITQDITQAALRAFDQAFLNSFRFIWITAASFVFVALVASFFVFDPTTEFNMHIDAPAEKEEDMYGAVRQIEQSELKA